jgi:hypothetical protein
MKVGDLVRFKKKGHVGTIVAKGHDRWNGTFSSVWVHVHNWRATRGNTQNPALFRIGHLREIVEVINESR